MSQTQFAIQPSSNAPQLTSLIKSARDIMRKDKGLNGDLDRLPMLTWIMFLKFLDDLEQIRREEAKIAGVRFRPAIESPYRWQDWAAKDDGITGDALIAFINQENTVLPNGSEGPGLFSYLRSLQSTNGDRRDVIATVFRGTVNRMINGYLLRDVINKVNSIHFSSSEEVHFLGYLYESMLKEMRDAAGDSGEFYTPRPVVRFMVDVIDPQIGEIVLDPACGTGGFLVEAFTHLEKKCKTIKDRQFLQGKSLVGGEAKSLPYLLCQMNLLLHGAESPSINPGNSLAVNVNELGAKDRVDIVLTNPPFGGEEERGILSNFPHDKQTAETTLLFLELIMRKLRRQPPGRAAVIVPNGTLYEKGVAARIREELLREFQLFLVVRLPKGVFEPYTDIATNILFFRYGGPTKKVWFYEHPLPPHRANLKGKSYSATDSVTYEEFLPILGWLKKPVENENAWAVPVDVLASSDFDLAQTHPRHANIQIAPPVELIRTAREHQKTAATYITRLEQLVGGLAQFSGTKQRLGDLFNSRNDKVRIESSAQYSRVRVQLHFKGAKLRDTAVGADIGSKNQTRVSTGDLIVSRIDARNGAMALIPPELDGAIVTNDFPVFVIDQKRIDPQYLRYLLFQPSMLRVYEKLSRGSTNRRRLIVDDFLNLTVFVPDTPTHQQEVSKILQEVESLIEQVGIADRQIMGNLSSLLASSTHFLFAES
jgi:type I restriction enzyme M protein